MSWARRACLALVFGFVFLVPVIPANGPSVTAPTEEKSAPTEYVRIDVPGVKATTLGPDVDIVETYDSFVLARAPSTALARLAARGVTAVPEDTFSLHVNGYAFDTRQGVRVPAALATTPVAEGRAYYLVQFVGPIKEDWRWRLEAHGPHVVAYVPNNAFVVQSTPAQMDAARTLREVQWVGDYHPAFRISPELLAAEGTVTVKIITFAGEPVEAVVAALNKMGLRLIGRWATDKGILMWQQFDDFGLVRARLDASLLVPLARFRGVRYIEPNLAMRLENQNAQFVLQTNATSSTSPNARRLWDMGLHGEGQVIALADTGVDFDHTMFRHSQTQPTIGDIYNVTNTARRKVIRYLPMSGYVGVDPFTGGDPNAIKDSPEGLCGVGHGTATSAAAAGDDTGMTPQSANDGMAPAAKLVMMDIGGVSTGTNCADTLSYIPDNYDNLFGPAFAASGGGARIFSNSWGGASSSYTLDARMADRFMWNNPDALILFANGNNPPNPTVGSPATAKNVVSVSGAASWTTGGRESMGAASRGPTADGRRKPDTTTIFVGSTALSDGALDTLNSGDWAGNFGGTSYATPLAAGMAALARQYYIQGWYPVGTAGGGIAILPSGALLKATLAAGSVQMASNSACPSTQTYPNNIQGWGRIWLDEALHFAGDTKKLFVVDYRNGIGTGDAVEYRLRLSSSTGRLRAFLAWTDAPALEGASPALVNNLDLEVTDLTSSTVYRGNVAGTCATGQTVTGGSFDSLNNLEGVVRVNPNLGGWRIRVIGASVPQGPQPFALVVLADMDRSYGIVEVNKPVYSEADTISIKVTDGDATAVSVQVASNTEPGGETVALSETVPGGKIWAKTLPTNYGVPGADGKIQVSHGDVITVTYNDVSPPHAAVATARVEVDGAAISNVRATSITNAAATITWITDKPSDSTVFYGTTPSLGTVASDPVQTIFHSITLTGLTTETVYYFDVASARAGHTVRDTNGGLHYKFKTTEKAEILLVVAHGSFSVERVSEYRSALQSASWSWNEWEVARQGDPPVATLQSYKAVLWQVGLEEYPPIPDATATLLKSYVDNGGRLYVSGHDIGWAACDAGSSFNTGPRCNFVRSILKAIYLADPQTFSLERGIAMDPISGGYTTGVPYVPHRNGGAGDEVDKLNVGGVTNFAWQTNSGSAQPDDATRWESSGVNGTAGPGCTWCGTRSRVVAYFFEFSGINFVSGQASNPQRTDILNKTIVWLLGRSPPIVRVTSPNGNEVITASPLTVAWTRSQPLSLQDIWYSRDGGQSWDFIKTVGATASSDAIDITNVANWPNGDRYQMRVVVTDTGTPAFKAQDASDATFRISRPGGDVEGPLVRAGSLRLFPNPARNGQTVTINATVDDTLRGLSNIDTAELFVQAAEPTAAQFATGTTMTAVDGGFDEAVEDVQATMSATWPVGSMQTVWVHGRDAATPTKNWGAFAGGAGANRTFLVLSGTAVPPPNPPTGVTARLVGASFENVRITWTIPSGPAIDHFEIYFSSTYDPAKTGYALLPGAGTIPATQSTFDDPNHGNDANTYFYYVRAVNLGGGANSVEQAAKLSRALSGGWNLVSIPVTLQDATVSSALQTMNWRTARTYVALSPADPWKAAYSGRTGGDLGTLSAGTALWVNLVAPDDFTVAGQVPASTTITLAVGWNFVGYASFVVRAANVAFPAALGVNQLEGYNGAASPYYLQRLALTANLEPGKGYWVYATAGGPWTVAN